MVRLSEEPVSTLAAILFIRLLKKLRSETFYRFSVTSVICTKHDDFDFQTKKTWISVLVILNDCS